MEAQCIVCPSTRPIFQQLKWKTNGQFDGEEQMQQQRGLKSIATVGILLAVLTVSMTFAGGPPETRSGGSIIQAVPSIFLRNSYLQVLSAPGGRFVIGVTQGNPATSSDNNKRLLYGYPGHLGSSFSTLQISRGSITSNVILGTAEAPDPTGLPPVASPVSDGTTLTTRWEQDQVSVVEQISFAQNPKTERPDTVAISYTLTNHSSENLQVGLRILLDLAVGRNDAAPVVIEGTGERITQEAEWLAGAVPEGWSAYESATFSLGSLKAQGQLSGGDATSPDRFVVADWDDAKETAWDYSIDPGKQMDDSALLLYYGPQTLAPGQTTTLRTYVGATIGVELYLPQVMR